MTCPLCKHTSSRRQRIVLYSDVLIKKSYTARTCRSSICVLLHEYSVVTSRCFKRTSTAPHTIPLSTPFNPCWTRRSPNAVLHQLSLHHDENSCRCEYRSIVLIQFNLNVDYRLVSTTTVTAENSKGMARMRKLFATPYIVDFYLIIYGILSLQLNGLTLRSRLPLREHLLAHGGRYLR
jgi:hypothetical protein